MFALAHAPTPMLNTESGILSLDAQGLLRELEGIALPKTKFKIIDNPARNVFKVTTREYPQAVFVDRRFLSFCDLEPPERIPYLRTKNHILEILQTCLGFEYVWGGNWPYSIDFEKLPKGFDCSGLLYYATDGMTPRNTSDLVYWGNGVSIQGLNAHSLIKVLKPLDLIVWKGHVIIVGENQRSIESLLGKGVVEHCLLDRIEQVIQNESRVPVNIYGGSSEKTFVVRRFIDRLPFFESSQE